ncbi:hypothetical protein PtB15_8B517 [Puccinia triticina]|nr:hypothetical protein PtB15_8B517 [Puccinia triticina]
MLNYNSPLRIDDTFDRFQRDRSGNHQWPWRERQLQLPTSCGHQGVEPPLGGPTEVPLDSPLKIRQNVVAIYQNIAGTSMSFAVLQQVMIANISALVFELKLNTKVSHSSPYT